MKKIISTSFLSVFVLVAVAMCKENTSTDLQKTFFVSQGGKLVVSVSGGDIQVRVWDKMQVQMTAQNIGDDANRVEADQVGNTITVQYKPQGGWWGGNRDLKFEFYVPKDFNLDLTTSGGDIGIGGDLAGDVELSTSGGDLKIDDVNGKVDGKTSGGDITVHNLEKDATLYTSGGDINVDHATNNLEISTSGGDITVGTVGKNLNASTAGGDISIEKVDGELHATTSSGDMTVGKIGGSVDITTSGGDITLNSGNGRITASTSGGDVDVINATGSVDISSAGGTVKVGLTPSGEGESKVVSSGGDVYLYVPSDAKANIKAEVSGGDEGDIICDFPNVNRSNGFGNEKEEIVLNGGGQEIYLHTSSGSIYVKKLNSFSK
ncbi:MAG: DUF4097 family beta strand repeat-containing protein [Candidatus Kryptoniota bacterium]